MRIALALIVAIGLLAPAVAQAQECVPACRSGYVCHQGACLSACNPACPAAEVCTPAGECVSRCNPPCAAGQRCGEDGECRGGDRVVTRPATTVAVSPGWASKAGKLGVGTAVVIGGATVAIVIANDTDIGLPIGIAATLIGAVMIPLVAAGGASARKSGRVEGNPGLRRTGWIAYAGSLVDALILIGLGFADADVPVALAGSVGALGASSAVFFAIDAFASASQARDLAHPHVGLVRDADGRQVATIGLQWRFQ